MTLKIFTIQLKDNKIPTSFGNAFLFPNNFISENE